MPYPDVDDLIRHMWRYTEDRPNHRVFAILDAARDERIYPALSRTLKDFQCLYLGHKLLFLGKMPPALAKVAPYVVSLKPRAPFTRWILSRGWGNSWGIYFVSDSSLNELVRHLRRFLMVRDEKGKTFYFRYYDPRVMRIYLPTCQEKEHAMVFGPVERYFVEDE